MARRRPVSRTQATPTGVPRVKATQIGVAPNNQSSANAALGTVDPASIGSMMGEPANLILDWEDFLATRKALIEFEHTSVDSYEKAMLTLAAGALGISLTFIQQLAPKPHDTLWLFVAWAGFGLALVVMLISFLASHKAIRKQYLLLDEEQRFGKPVDNPQNKWATATSWFNWISLGSFCIGVSCLAAFVGMNLPH